MNWLTVKLANKARRVWISTLADYLEGDATARVPDVAYWRKEIARGALVIVADEPKAEPAESTPAVVDEPASEPVTQSPAPQQSGKRKKKGKRKPADPPPPANALPIPPLGQAITKAERFGDEE